MPKLGGKRNYSWDDSISDISTIQTSTSSQTQSQKKKVPASFSLDEELVKKLNNFCYWERKNKSQVVEELISSFLKKSGNEENLKDKK